MWLALGRGYHVAHVLGAEGPEGKAAIIPPWRDSLKTVEMVGPSPGRGVGRPRIEP